MDFRLKLYHSYIKHQNNVAACIDDITYTYDQLYCRVGGIANLITKYNITGSVNRIGIVCNNDLDTYASMLACWFTGVAYVPINPLFPYDRNLKIIKESSISLLLDSTGDFICANSNLELAHGLHITKNCSSSNLEFSSVITSEENEIYILFTSGSTGVPKGVPINSTNLNYFIEAFDDLGLELSEKDKFLQMFELTFDVSVASFVIPLLRGASFFTINPRKIKYLEIYRISKQYEITVATIVPSIINFLRPYLKEVNLPSIKYCILTAEATVLNDILEFKKSISNATILNLYGPTEATIWCTSYLFDNEAPKTYNGMLAIGKPFSQIKAFVINDLGIEQPNFEKGELIVNGNQITIGYLNNSERNESAFLLIDGERFYRTGDLAYRDENGIIFYCGRVDTQVKIQGFRIELSEIEVNVRDLLGFNNIALAIENRSGIKEIVLFVENSDCTQSQIQSVLSKKLPQYMIPAKVLNVGQFPINSSGKFDKIKLRSFLND